MVTGLSDIQQVWQVSGTICFQVQEATTPAGEAWKLFSKVNRKIALHPVVKAAEFESLDKVVVATFGVELSS